MDDSIRSSGPGVSLMQMVGPRLSIHSQTDMGRMAGAYGVSRQSQEGRKGRDRRGEEGSDGDQGTRQSSF